VIDFLLMKPGGFLEPEQKLSFRDFDEEYKGTPPWDIGRPQKAFVLAEERGELHGSILDVGCGTGETSLYLSSRGHEVVGIDSSPRAIRKAQEKARGRNIRNISFRVADALNLSRELNRAFDNVTDCGLFHGLTDEQRLQFMKSLNSVLKTNGKYFMLCFSDLAPRWSGHPRRVSQVEIREWFSDGWTIDYIKESLIDRFEADFSLVSEKAWFSSITRT
jgi:cyclopropane fatty-acyl-phospholipid synthase-like methyltransferase